MEKDEDGLSEVGSVSADWIAADLRPLAWPVNDLRPSPDNARKHTDADLSALSQSLRLGQQKPIVVKRTYRGVTNAVIAGNGTLQAARRLGWSHVAVTWFGGTDDEARAYAIRDNRTAELSAWDADQLAALQADGVDLLALWHDDVALADLLHEGAPTPRFEPEAPARRLDELADNTTCPNCGHRFHRGAQ